MREKHAIDLTKYPLSNDRAFTEDGRIITHVKPGIGGVVRNEYTGAAFPMHPGAYAGAGGDGNGAGGGYVDEGGLEAEPPPLGGPGRGNSFYDHYWESLSVDVDDNIFIYTAPYNLYLLTGDDLDYNANVFTYRGYKYWQQPLVFSPGGFSSQETIYFATYSDKPISQWLNLPNVTLDGVSYNDWSYWTCATVNYTGPQEADPRWHVIDETLHEELWGYVLDVDVLYSGGPYETPVSGWSSDGTAHTGKWCIWKFDVDEW